MRFILIAIGFTLMGCAAENSSQDKTPSAIEILETHNEGSEEDSNLNDLEWAQKATKIIGENANAPGISVVLIKDGAVLGYINYGKLHRDKPEAISETTYFQIASLSKIFTGIIAKSMIMKGQISKDDSVLDFIPGELSAAARLKLQGITVRDVLNHRAGLPRDSMVIIRNGNDPMLTGLTEEGLLKDLEIAEFVGSPGVQYEYSNLGYAFMGYILERASGKSYDDLVREFVLTPYGMSQTHTQLNESQEAHMATPYRKEDRTIETKPWVTGKLVSASGIYSTTQDLGKLIAAQTQTYATQLTGHALNLTEDTRFVSDNRSYGYGMNKDKFMSGDASYDFYYHSGDMDGFAAVYMMTPETGSGVVVLTSSGGGWKNGLGVMLLKKMMGEHVDMPVLNE